MLPITVSYEKHLNYYQEVTEESDAIFGVMVKQNIKLKISQEKTDFAQPFDSKF